MSVLPNAITRLPKFERISRTASLIGFTTCPYRATGVPRLNVYGLLTNGVNFRKCANRVDYRTASIFPKDEITGV
jgi:hypothetical protein